jgi:Photosynthetic reaction centre cytochrome C subunit
MRRVCGIVALAIATCVVLTGGDMPASAASGQEPPQQARPTIATPPNSQQNQEVNDRLLKQLVGRIKGRENEPAAEVFKNIQIPWLKAVPAGLFLRIMNGGYSRALGVNCTHCHVEEDFASDDKRQKRAAREMAKMHRMINEQLGEMEHLKAPVAERSINCATCHRGAISPLAADR